jgi:predicted dehydrogenase
MRTLRIGFVGGGFIARFHLRSLVAVRGVVVAGVATPSGGAELVQLAAELGVAADGGVVAFDDVESLAAADGIDALWICARNDARVPVMAAIERGAARRAEPLLGIAVEKPLARTLAEAEEVVRLAAAIGAPTAYLEDMLFAPSLVRGKEVAWRRGAGVAGRPYLARASEEHSGPHSKWFWQPELAGGGALIDMMCHSIEAARWLLTEPGAARSSLVPVAVSATVANLKWIHEPYASQLRERFGPDLDWAAAPSEDFARATITWRVAGGPEAGREVISETSSSWCYVGAGLRHEFQLLGPEYALDIDMARTGVDVFMSRNVTGEAGEDLVEKQNAEQGLMPISPNETAHYGYEAENRAALDSFRAGLSLEPDFAAGLEVTRLLMAAYLSAAEGRSVDPFESTLENFRPTFGPVIRLDS